MKQSFLIVFIAISTISYAQEQKKVKIYSPLKKYEILLRYGHKNSTFGSWYHCADDLIGSGGTPVYAMADGEIVFSAPMKSNAWLIIIEHKSLGVFSMYAHLSTRRDKLLAGSKVKGNQRIAFLADDDEDGSDLDNGTGKAGNWGPHLHFAIRKGKKEDYPTGKNKIAWFYGYSPKHPKNYNFLDPMKYIKENN